MAIRLADGQQLQAVLHRLEQADGIHHLLERDTQGMHQRHTAGQVLNIMRAQQTGGVTARFAIRGGQGKLTAVGIHRHIAVAIGRTAVRVAVGQVGHGNRMIADVVVVEIEESHTVFGDGVHRDGVSRKAQREADLFELVGRKRGFLVSGGEINHQRTAQMLLEEFRSAKIGNKMPLDLFIFS